jgi:hypothetical protein
MQSTKMDREWSDQEKKDLWVVYKRVFGGKVISELDANQRILSEGIPGRSAGEVSRYLDKNKGKLGHFFRWLQDRQPHPPTLEQLHNLNDFTPNFEPVSLAKERSLRSKYGQLTYQDTFLDRQLGELIRAPSDFDWNLVSKLQPAQ